MAEHDENQEEAKGFRVVDRRRFTTAGEIRGDAVEANEDTRAGEPAPVAPPAASAHGQRSQRSRSSPSDPRSASDARASAAAEATSIDFLSFAASLATNALAALGLLPDEHARGLPRNPELAREYIEILAMLQQKTRGNLTRQEDAALAQMLADLRVQYVESTRTPAAPRR